MPDSMSPEKVAAIAVGAVALIIILIILIRFSPKRLRSKHFIKRWHELQAKCSDPKLWPEVLKEADNLLDEALKRRRIKGKTMGERMVSAQKLFTDNDTVWYGHKLRKKYEAKPGTKLTEQQMKKALIGLGKALKDLGALKSK